MTPLEAVKEFHEAFDVPIESRPTIPTFSIRHLREKLITEEYSELKDALHDHDLVEIADALADLTVVVYGTALAYGIPLDDVFAEVHRSNMSKLGEDGKPILRDDGKVLKGPNFFKPDIERILNDASSD